MSTPRSRFVSRPSRPQIIVEALTKIAHERGPGAQMPTTTELRELFGGSLTTITVALDELEARQIIERQVGKGTFVSAHLHRRNVRVLFDAHFVETPHVSPIWGMLWGFLTAECQRRSELHGDKFDFRILPSVTKPDSPALLEIKHLLETNQLQGLLGIGFNNALFSEDDLKAMPFVGFAGHYFWDVLLDSAAEFNLALDALLQNGCRRIGFWPLVHPKNSYNFLTAERDILAFQNAMQSRNIDFDASLVETDFTPLDLELPFYAQRRGYHLARKWFGSPHSTAKFDKQRLKNIDGLIIADDMVADGALTAFQEMGLQPARDLHLVTMSHKDSVMLYRAEKSITVLEYDPRDIVHLMFSTLEKLMSGKKPRNRFTYLQPRPRIYQNDAV